MSEEMGVSSGKLHDFFHSTWSRQFYSCLSSFKAEITEILKSVEETSTVQRIRVVQEEMLRRHPQCKFHYQSLYQFINYQTKRVVEYKQ